MRLVNVADGGHGRSALRRPPRQAISAGITQFGDVGGAQSEHRATADVGRVPRHFEGPRLHPRRRRGRLDVQNRQRSGAADGVGGLAGRPGHQRWAQRPEAAVVDARTVRPRYQSAKGPGSSNEPNPRNNT